MHFELYSIVFYTFYKVWFLLPLKKLYVPANFFPFHFSLTDATHWEWDEIEGKEESCWGWRKRQMKGSIHDRHRLKYLGLYILGEIINKGLAFNFIPLVREYRIYLQVQKVRVEATEWGIRNIKTIPDLKATLFSTDKIRIKKGRGILIIGIIRFFS